MGFASKFSRIVLKTLVPVGLDVESLRYVHWGPDNFTVILLLAEIGLDGNSEEIKSARTSTTLSAYEVALRIDSKLFSAGAKLKPEFFDFNVMSTRPTGLKTISTLRERGHFAFSILLFSLCCKYFPLLKAY